MMDLFRRIKAWGAEVKTEKWHFRLVKYVDGKVPQKACTYYWVSVPIAMFHLVWVCGLVVIFGVIGWFLGFTINLHGGEYDLYLPYKTRRNGKRKLCAPWEVAIVAAVMSAVYYFGPWAVSHIDMVLAVFVNIMAVSAVVGMLAGVVFMAVSRARRRRRQQEIGSSKVAPTPVGDWVRKQSRRVRNFWDEACPDLVVK